MYAYRVMKAYGEELEVVAQTNLERVADRLASDVVGFVMQLEYVRVPSGVPAYAPKAKIERLNNPTK